MFKRFFQKNWTYNLSKADYCKKWELFELFDDLYKAEQLLTEIGKEKNDDIFLRFLNDFIEERFELEGENVADFTRIWEWFSPGKEWDKFTEGKGMDLGSNIFRITNRWKRNQDFVEGTKVSLKNEFGVVLDKFADNNMYGQIRWDTSKENDIEDWRGLFGSFLKVGGKIIDQEHQFTFINDDGSMKNQ
jgi:hypothetical protein